MVDGRRNIGRRGRHAARRLAEQIHGESTFHRERDEIVVGKEAGVQGAIATDVLPDRSRSPAGHLP